MRVVIFELLFAPTVGVADELRSGVEADRRNACFGERKMVGAVEASLFGSRVERDREVVFLRDLFDRFAERGAFRAEQRDVGRLSQHVHRIEVDVGDGVAKGNERIARVIFRAEQSLLFRRRRDEEDRTFGPDGQRSAGFGDGQDAGDAGRVIDRAVVNVIAGLIGANPQVIPGG